MTSSRSNPVRALARVLKRCIALPETAGMDLDDPRTTQARAAIVRRKAFLRHLYEEWYALLSAVQAELPTGPLVELGSGPGFLGEFLPGLVTSEVFYLPSVDLVLSGERLPFADESIAGIFMVDVLHHIPRPARFFAEAQRCLKPGGRVAMIEPWNSTWGRLVWRYLHHEPFEPGAGWELEEGGPLSNANGALPWILTERDRERFKERFPKLRPIGAAPFMPLAYLLSGGVSARSLLPGFAYRPWRAAERLLSPCNRALGMFAVIQVGKQPVDLRPSAPKC